MKERINWNMESIKEDSFSVGSGWSGVRCYVLIDPDKKMICPWRVVGAGMPSSVFEGRAVMAPVPHNTAGRAVKQLLLENVEILDEICHNYLGVKSQFGVHSGDWADYDRKLLAVREIGDKIRELPRYVTAEELIDWWAHGTQSLAESYISFIEDGLNSREATEIINEQMEDYILISDQEFKKAVEEDLRRFREDTLEEIEELIDEMVDHVNNELDWSDTRDDIADMVTTYGKAVRALAKIEEGS